jgi:glutamine cyclotransferase
LRPIFNSGQKLNKTGFWLILVWMVLWASACSANPSELETTTPAVKTTTVISSSPEIGASTVVSGTPALTGTTPPGSPALSIPPSPQPVPTYTYEIINVYPHDREAFTQGLVFEDSQLYEGTGLRGQSTLRRVELETGEVQQFINLPAEYFGEGITVYGDKIIQLTWQSHKGFVYDKSSLALLKEFSYPTEGWGITHDGRRLIMSDGTDRLYFLDPESLEATGQVPVTDNSLPVVRINELEFINGQVYANIWQTDRIAIIDPVDGRVTAWVNLEGLLETQPYGGHVDVLNGIAYDSESDRLLVTGKLWPYLFEIRLTAAGEMR